MCISFWCRGIAAHTSMCKEQRSASLSRHDLKALSVPSLVPHAHARLPSAMNADSHLFLRADIQFHQSTSDLGHAVDMLGDSAMQQARQATTNEGLVPSSVVQEHTRSSATVPRSSLQCMQHALSWTTPSPFLIVERQARREARRLIAYARWSISLYSMPQGSDQLCRSQL